MRGFRFFWGFGLFGVVGEQVWVLAFGVAGIGLFELFLGHVSAEVDAALEGVVLVLVGGRMRNLRILPPAVSSS